MTGSTKKIATILKEKFEEQNIASEIIDVNKTTKRRNNEGY